MAIIFKEKIVGKTKVMMLSTVGRNGRGQWRRMYVLSMPHDLVYKTTKNKFIEVHYDELYRVSQSYSSEFTETDRYKNSSQGIVFKESEEIFNNIVDSLLKK